MDGRGTGYEIEYDLAGIPFGEPVTVEIAALARFPVLMSGRAPFTIKGKTDLLSVWMLFPKNRPYRTYSLVRYPADNSAPAADDGPPEYDRPPLWIPDWLVGSESSSWVSLRMPLDNQVSHGLDEQHARFDNPGTAPCVHGAMPRRSASYEKADSYLRIL